MRVSVRSKSPVRSAHWFRFPHPTDFKRWHESLEKISEKRKEDAVQDLEELQNTVSNLIEILDKLIDKYNI